MCSSMNALRRSLNSEQRSLGWKSIVPPAGPGRADVRIGPGVYRLCAPREKSFRIDRYRVRADGALRATCSPPAERTRGAGTGSHDDADGLRRLGLEGRYGAAELA